MGPLLKKTSMKEAKNRSARLELLSTKKMQGTASDLEHKEWLELRHEQEKRGAEEINELSYKLGKNA